MAIKLEKKGGRQGSDHVGFVLHWKVCGRDASEGFQARAGHNQEVKVTSTQELKQNVRGKVPDCDGSDVEGRMRRVLG